MERLDLIGKNESFVQQVQESDPTYFGKLSEGQHPNCFMIACSDSRVSPSVITQAPLGYLFVHRNVANQVVTADHSLTAGLYYALKHLQVKKVVITGHTGCGGIHAARTGNQEPELRPWLDHVEEALQAHLGGPAGPSLDDLARLNVLRQMERLAEHPVYRAHGSGVAIEGYLLHLDTGRLELLDRREANVVIHP